MRIPLFPLNTVLFPGGPLPLRIFEARYVDMIGECMRNGMPFGVVLIRDGHEVGPATTHEVGTLAKIVDFYQGSDGLLGVTAFGTQRFRVRSVERQADGLNVADVELIANEDPEPLPAKHRGIADILEAVLDDLGRLYDSLERHYDDANWVSNRFIEILPIELERKQQCLENSSVSERLGLVCELLDTVRGPGATAGS